MEHFEIRDSSIMTRDTALTLGVDEEGFEGVETPEDHEAKSKLLQEENAKLNKLPHSMPSFPRACWNLFVTVVIVCYAGFWSAKVASGSPAFLRKWHCCSNLNVVYGGISWYFWPFFLYLISFQVSDRMGSTELGASGDKEPTSELVLNLTEYFLGILIATLGHNATPIRLKTFQARPTSLKAANAVNPRKKHRYAAFVLVTVFIIYTLSWPVKVHPYDFREQDAPPLPELEQAKADTKWYNQWNCCYQLHIIMGGVGWYFYPMLVLVMLYQVLFFYGLGPFYPPPVNSADATYLIEPTQLDTSLYMLEYFVGFCIASFGYRMRRPIRNALPQEVVKSLINFCWDRWCRREPKDKTKEAE